LLRVRGSNVEKRKHLTLEEVEEMFVIKRKCQALYQRERERVENVNLEVISITESKFVMVYIYIYYAKKSF